MTTDFLWELTLQLHDLIGSMPFKGNISIKKLEDASETSKLISTEIKRLLRQRLKTKKGKKK